MVRARVILDKNSHVVKFDDFRRIPFIFNGCVRLFNIPNSAVVPINFVVYVKHHVTVTLPKTLKVTLYNDVYEAAMIYSIRLINFIKCYRTSEKPCIYICIYSIQAVQGLFRHALGMYWKLQMEHF